MKEESKGQLVFFYILLKRNKGKISVLIYWKSTDTDQYQHYNSHHQTSCKESVVSSFLNRTYSIVANNYCLYKEHTRIKQVLKENGYQESILGKIFRRIANNHILLQSQEQTQATDIQEEEIRMPINLLYDERTSEKRWSLLRSCKVRSTFYT